MDDVSAPPFDDVYQGRRVLVTGHTGFKGGWLSLWLQKLGAHVIGFAQPPDVVRSFFERAAISQGMESVIGDVRDLRAVGDVFRAHQPEIVFHLAAQSLVRASYERPVETMATNVMGTVHALEAARDTPSVRAVVVVTSDKCYENHEWSYAYRENDRVGGADPYSASKGAAELVTASYRRSFATGRNGERSMGIATARAGNVIGGGDRAPDRIVPDCVRALAAGEPIAVRNPRSVRPWQHVLEPLSGYLWLGAKLWQDISRFAEAWNFGPADTGVASVAELVERVIASWGGGEWRDVSTAHTNAPSEATSLKLDCTKARGGLGWCSVLPLDRAVDDTVAWYHREQQDGNFDAKEFSIEQISAYTELARAKGQSWSGGALRPIRRLS